MPLKNIPIGSLVHCIEMKPGKGAQLARSAGASVQLVAREGEYVTIRLRSGELRKAHVNCSRDDRRGRQRRAQPAQDRQSRRATLARYSSDGSCVAMNPVDHPHGGGEGKSGQGNPHPVTPWGQKTKGYKTRRNKRTKVMIVRDRRQK